MNNKVFLVSLLSGLLFGLGMNISGMVDPNNIFAFLDITGNWDPSLAFVMTGALAIFTPMYHFCIKKRNRSINGETFNFSVNKKIDKSLVIGSIIFGLGWAIGGICPGPAISSILYGGSDIFIFITSMLIGIKLASLIS